MDIPVQFCSTYLIRRCQSSPLSLELGKGLESKRPGTGSELRLGPEAKERTGAKAEPHSATHCFTSQSRGNWASELAFFAHLLGSAPHGAQGTMRSVGTTAPSLRFLSLLSAAPFLANSGLG